MSELISVEWLIENIDDPDLVLLDASLSATAQGKQADNPLITILGARFFDLKNDFSDPESPFPNTLPSAAQFEHGCQKLGINRNSKIVVFDNMGIYSSPRVWWMFKIMGLDSISVLDGGLPDWIESNQPTEQKTVKESPLGNFKANLHQQFVKTYEDILDNVSTQAFCVVDARSKGRFKGTEEEPRKHLKSGHIPQSINIPYQVVLDNGKFKPKDELKALFDKTVLKDKDLVFSCGSGLTACIVMLASEIAYKSSKTIYDGSWTEWAELQNLKVEG